MSDSSTALPEIFTERLALRMPPATMAARVAQFEQENTAHLSPWEPVMPGLATEEFWAEQLPANEREFRAGRSMRLFVFLMDAGSDALIGFCNLNDIRRGGRHCCQLGFAIDYRWQGRGLMSEALASAIAFAFGRLLLHRIMAEYAPENARSARVLARLGFAVEGVAREALFVRGAWRDLVRTALINLHP